jgi:hypothetical protein
MCSLLPPDQITILARFQNRNGTPTLRHTHALPPDRLAHMKVLRAGFACILLLVAIVQIWDARAQYVGREQNIVNLRLGQRVLVDDGTCPAGQVKEVSGSKMTPTGVIAARKCIPRLGPKKK